MILRGTSPIQHFGPVSSKWPCWSPLNGGHSTPEKVTWNHQKGHECQSSGSGDGTLGIPRCPEICRCLTQQRVVFLWGNGGYCNSFFPSGFETGVYTFAVLKQQKKTRQHNIKTWKNTFFCMMMFSSPWDLKNKNTNFVWCSSKTPHRKESGACTGGVFMNLFFVKQYYLFVCLFPCFLVCLFSWFS